MANANAIQKWALKQISGQTEDVLSGNCCCPPGETLVWASNMAERITRPDLAAEAKILMRALVGFYAARARPDLN